VARDDDEVAVELLVFDGSRGEAKADRVAADFRKFQGSRLVAAIRSLAFVEEQHRWVVAVAARSGELEELHDKRCQEDPEGSPGGDGANPVEREVAPASRLPVHRHRLGIPGQHHVVVRLREPVGHQ
jgi:hypothetical protein